jgi:hypothetical protein
LAACLRGSTSELKVENLTANIQALLPTEENCVFCDVRVNAESETIASTRRRLVAGEAHALGTLSTVCIPHFAMLAAVVEDPRLLSRLMEFEATICERLADDMRRYALKHDAVRRLLVSEEEMVAAQRALMFVAGHRHINARAKNGR